MNNVITCRRFLIGKLAAILIVASISSCSQKADLQKDKDVFSYAPEPELVDMGLSVHWAKWNVGENSEFGMARQLGWGDLNGTAGNDLDKCPCPFPPESISATQYDVSSCLWGKGWRLPTEEDFIELSANSDMNVGEIGGVTYLCFKSRITGNSIYLPYAQSYDGLWYWTGDLDKNDTRKAVAWGKGQDVDTKRSCSSKSFLRSEKICIRPVYEYSKVVTGGTTGEVTGKSMRLYARLSFTARENYEQCGFYIADDPASLGSAGIDDRILCEQHYNIASFYSNVEGLKRNTTYYFRAYVIVDGKEYLGNILSASTLNAYEVGDFWPDDNSPIGVVFDIDYKGLSGKLLSFEQLRSCEWEPSPNFYVSANDKAEGYRNKLPERSPIYQWLCKLGEGWYCPAINELARIHTNLSVINGSLAAGGHEELNNVYWASTQYSVDRYDCAWVYYLTKTMWGDNLYRTYQSKSYCTANALAAKCF